MNADQETLTLAQLNDMDDVESSTYFRRCCAAESWVEKMVKGKPYQSLESCLNFAHESWQGLSEEDYLQAFSAHPKIGDVSSLQKKYADTHALAAGEQSGAQLATEQVILDLAAGNQEYEDKFGFIFIVFATGKSAEQMLALLQARLPNSREQEIQNAADNQEKITALRIRKLLGEADSPKVKQ